ncbi:MAG: alpha/beta fold hydrolase [Mobilicoccus sp.]|nr:alpha/beta fold hydrolase [Mobilicoccus sp.]
MVIGADQIRARLTHLPGIDPAWSRTVRATDADGIERTWHLLDTHADTVAAGERPDVEGTLLAVHGNPSWSYLWRRLLAAPARGWRVIAVDQLGMGFSEHPRGTLEAPRSLQQRIDDLAGLTDVLDLGERVVVAGHDWGGMVATGWALDHPDQLAGIILANTTVRHDFDSGLPTPLRFSHLKGLLRRVTVDTPTFVRAATLISSPRPSAEIRDAYAAPYGSAAHRLFVGQFVADIPSRAQHRTRATMDRLADGLAALGAVEDPAARVPVLLLRGPKDPVFSEAHLKDLRTRVPHADVHRYEGASHLVLEDAPRSAADIATWISSRVDGGHSHDPAARDERPELASWAVGTSTEPWAGLTEMARTHPDALCVAEVRTGRSVTFGEMESRIEAVAHGLRAHGVRAGERVGLLVEPGADLTTVVYACWRVGAVIVVADAGLGLPNLGRVLRGAGTDHVIGIPKAMAAVPALRIPGTRIVAGELNPRVRQALGVTASLSELEAAGRDAVSRGGSLPTVLTGDADAAVLFTSGATGPSKGVVYTVDQLRAMIGGFGHIYDLTPGDTLVAAFAPFALYGPALGVGGVTPDMKVTAPSTLTAAALADAVLAADGTTVFASPAALRNVLRTAITLTAEGKAALERVKVVMSAGAPVPQAMLRELRTVMPNAEFHTPYGMTECLPVADITLTELEQLGEDEGICVGHPLETVTLAVAPLAARHDDPDGALTSEPGVMGEICVHAPHVKDRYDQLWATEHAAAAHPHGWHRTGDVGHLDETGRLWVEGRRVHVVDTPEGPVTPVGLEQKVEALPEVASAAVVGVGPRGVQQIVVVVVLDDPPSPLRVLAEEDLAEKVRAVSARPVAAVLVREAMPVDIRHQSKIDRAELADWAEGVLSGRTEATR